jgi:hypothetical protein
VNQRPIAGLLVTQVICIQRITIDASSHTNYLPNF